MKNDLVRMPWVPRYEKRKDFSRKIRDTEKQVDQHKAAGNWEEVLKLQHKLRNAWWGYKRHS